MPATVQQPSGRRMASVAHGFLRLPMLQVVHHVITRSLLRQAGVKAYEAASCAATPI